MRSIIGFLAIFFVFGSCHQFSDDIDMKSLHGGWEKNQVQNFDFEVKETSPKNLYLVVRNNDDYPYSNIRFFVTLKNVETKTTTTIDTLNYTLAKSNGEWLGNGFGNTKEILFQYKMNYSFANTGAYQIDIKQAMRKDTLVGIEDIGIKIENTTSK